MEVLLFRVMGGLLRVLPWRAAYALMEWIALFAHEGGGWRKSATRARIAEVFPDRGERERIRLRREAVRNLARNLVELIKGFEGREGEVEGLEATVESLRRSSERGRGTLLVIVHSGNWDLAGRLVAARTPRMCFIARAQKNERVYRELVRAREESGGVVVDRHDPRLIRKVLAQLEENAVVAILVDIRAKSPSSAYRFLGREAWLTNGLGLLAAKSQAEVVPVYLGREGRRRQIWKPMPPRRLPPAAGRAERDALLQGCLDELGREVLRRPGSYFWFNRRWVLEPPP